MVAEAPTADLPEETSGGVATPPAAEASSASEAISPGVPLERKRVDRTKLIWPVGERLPEGGNAKPYQVKQVRIVILKHKLGQVE